MYTVNETMYALKRIYTEYFDGVKALNFDVYYNYPEFVIMQFIPKNPDNRNTCEVMVDGIWTPEFTAPTVITRVSRHLDPWSEKSLKQGDVFWEDFGQFVHTLNNMGYDSKKIYCNIRPISMSDHHQDLLRSAVGRGDCPDCTGCEVLHIAMLEKNISVATIMTNF